MAKLIRCECGFIARGDNDDEVVAEIRGHMSTDHPDVLSRADQSEIESWIEST